MDAADERDTAKIRVGPPPRGSVKLDIRATPAARLLKLQTMQALPFGSLFAEAWVERSLDSPATHWANSWGAQVGLSARW